MKPTLFAQIWQWLHAETTLWQMRLMRLALGSVSLLWLISNLPHLKRDYSLEGMSQLIMKENATWGWQLLQALPGHELTIFIIGFLFHILFLHGRFARTASLGLWFWHKTLISINSISMNSEQYMMMWMFLYGVALPWSESANWLTDSHKKNASEQRYSMFLRLFQIHVCLIYAISTFWKIYLDPAWHQGESVAYVLMHPLWSKVAGQEWVVWSGVPEILTYSSLVLEGFFAFLIWYPSLRRPLVLSLLLFHFCLGVFFMQYIGFFTMAMMTALLSWTKPGDFTFRKSLR